MSQNENDSQNVNSIQPPPPPITPTDAMLYGLAGDVGRAAAQDTEVNPIAAAMDYLTFLSAMMGRDVYLPIGNTWHHARIFSLHVGRSGRGRKGDALSLIHRIRYRLTPPILGKIHTGGLSTREGLVDLIADKFAGDAETSEDENPDKRLWVVESEFANILHQAKRDGNTLSAALRDCWDGIDIAPATRNNKISCTAPHIALSAGVTPSELLSLIEQRELTNGFSSRFLIFWAERLHLNDEPQPTSETALQNMVQRTAEIIEFAKGQYPSDHDSRRAKLSEAARALYKTLYHNQLNAPTGSELTDALLERRAPVLLRLALLFALTDKTLTIELQHIEAANAWVRYWQDSVNYIFGREANLAAAKKVESNGKLILQFLQQRGRANRKILIDDCFRRHITATNLDRALNHLLTDNAIECEVEKRRDGKPGRGSVFYRIKKSTAIFANIAILGRNTGQTKDRNGCDLSDLSFLGNDSQTYVRKDRNGCDLRSAQEKPQRSLCSQRSQPPPPNNDDDAEYF